MEQDVSVISFEIVIFFGLRRKECDVEANTATSFNRVQMVGLVMVLPTMKPKHGLSVASTMLLFTSSGFFRLQTLR